MTLVFKTFDPNEPRDEQGRWTDGGGSDGSGGKEPSGSKPTASGGGFHFQPENAQAIEWHNQVKERIAKKEAEDKIGGFPGSEEDGHLQGMLGALGHYAYGRQDLKDQSHLQLTAVTDEHGQIQAAVSSSYRENTKVMEIVYAGGTSKIDLTDALVAARDHGREIGAKRVEGHSFDDDKIKMQAYQDAGFINAGQGVGVISWIYGEQTTQEERDEVARRQREYEKRIENSVYKAAQDLGFKKADIQWGNPNDPEQNFTLNGKQYKAAGVAHIYTDNTIKLWRDKLAGEKAAAGVTAHEIEHVKFQNALNRFRGERDALMKEPGPPPNPNAETHWERVGGFDAVMHPDGTVRPAYADKYPVYAMMFPAFGRPEWNEFVKGDGVTPYSVEYWTKWEGNKTAANFERAVHETLAEMAYIKYTEGSFPEHKGDNKAEKTKNAKIYRDLYRVVTKIYDLPGSPVPPPKPAT